MLPQGEFMRLWMDLWLEFRQVLKWSYCGTLTKVNQDLKWATPTIVSRRANTWIKTPEAVLGRAYP